MHFQVKFPLKNLFTYFYLNSRRDVTAATKKIIIGTTNSVLN